MGTTAPGKECHVSWRQVAAFRLKRHSLLERNSSDLSAICRDVCGIQAQLMASAGIALAVRARHLTCQDIDSALWQRRTLVKTYAMRQTLHLLPSEDFSIYITALRNSRMNALMRIMSKLKVTRAEVDAMNAAVMDALSANPLTKNERGQKIKPAISKGLKLWMKLSWNAFRSA